MEENSTVRSVVDEVVEHLEAAIFSGKFAPGQRIREARVAAELSVGPGLVREALRQLEGRRVVVRNRNLGTSVAKLSAEEAMQLLELREILEVGACRLAITNMSDEDLGRLQAILETHQQMKGQAKHGRPPLHYSEWHNYDFHYQIALASGNRRLIDLLCGEIWILMRAYRYPGALSPGRMPDGTGAHHEIMQALIRRDADACENAMRAHLRQFRQLVMEHLGKEQKKKPKKSVERVASGRDGFTSNEAADAGATSGS